MVNEPLKRTTGSGEPVHLGLIPVALPARGATGEYTGWEAGARKPGGDCRAFPREQGKAQSADAIARCIGVHSEIPGA